MQITAAQWHKYIEALSTVDKKAGAEMRLFLDSQSLDYSDPETIEMIVKYAYGLSEKYGDAVAELSCQMYDLTAKAQGVNVLAAEPAEVATYGETEKAIRGSLKQSPSGQLLQTVVERLVKQASADTMLKNAKRDGASFAWVPHGDTCPYCLALAAIGWQKAGKTTFNGTHAKHIHAHCDCTYAIDFKGDMEISGYDPDKYRDQFRKMTGDDSLDNDDMIRMIGHNAKGQSDYEYLNLIRRKNYAKNKDFINAQKRAAYYMRNHDADSLSVSGAISGARNPYGKAAEKHAVMYYDEIRKRKSDI